MILLVHRYRSSADYICGLLAINLAGTSPIIVMVTNIMEGNHIKCQQYWLESGKKDFNLDLFE